MRWVIYKIYIRLVHIIMGNIIMMWIKRGNASGETAEHKTKGQKARVKFPALTLTKWMIWDRTHNFPWALVNSPTKGEILIFIYLNGLLWEFIELRLSNIHCKWKILHKHKALALALCLEFIFFQDKGPPYPFLSYQSSDWILPIWWYLLTFYYLFLWPDS